MSIPGFTAETSIYKSNRAYVTRRVLSSPNITHLEAADISIPLDSRLVAPHVKLPTILRIPSRFYFDLTCLEQCYDRCCQFLCTSFRTNPRTGQVIRIFDDICYRDCLEAKGTICGSTCYAGCFRLFWV